MKLTTKGTKNTKGGEECRVQSAEFREGGFGMMEEVPKGAN